MTNCPKCGGSYIKGPSYIGDNGKVKDKIMYQCGTCGFTQFEPPKDSERNKEYKHLASQKYQWGK